MFKSKNKTARKVALGSVIAGIAGYVTGILTAPQSGQETREDIRDKASDIKDDARLELNIAQEKLAEAIREAQARASTISVQAKEEFNEALIRAKDAQNKAKTVLKAVKSGGSDDPELNKAVKQAKQATKNLGKFLKS